MRAIRRNTFLAMFSFLLISASTFHAAAQFSGGPSFGVMITRKKVVLKRKLAPLYDASGKSIAITIGKAPQSAEVEIALERQLTQNDSTIRVGGVNPDLVIDCQVSHFTEPHYVTVTETGGSSQHMVGDISVLFRMSEPRTKRVIKSDTASYQLSEATSRTTNASNGGKLFGVKIPGSTTPTTTNLKSSDSSPSEARVSMVAKVATQIAAYVVNTEETIEVPLAVGGTLNGPDKLAVGGLWSRNLEELETLSPSTDAKTEVYRLYNIGVANEALAYQAQDTKSAIKYLAKASDDYGKALDARPDEKNFVDAQTRIKSALAHYEQIGKIGSSSNTSSIAGVSAPQSTEPALTNDDVIEMFKNHIDEANILDSIEHAPEVNFDLGTKGQVKLTQGGVNGRVLLAMKRRSRGETTPTASPRR